MKRLYVTILTLLCVIGANAQGDSIYVSILAASPGVETYQLEGHAALRIRHGGDDFTVNWGIFDFDSPNFAYRFLKGETDYLCAACRTDYFIGSYLIKGRSVTEMELNISQDVARKIYELVAINLTPPNDVYRYRYFSDNCSTRPLEIVEKAIGVEITYQEFAPEENTIRKCLRKFHKDYAWYQFSIDIGLGTGVDKPITTRKKAFAPEYLPDLLSGGSYRSDKETIRLLKDVTYYQPDRSRNYPIDDIKPTAWYIHPLFLAIILLVAAALFTKKDLARKRTTHWFDIPFFAIVGIEGLILTFLVFVSTHEATSPNFNYLWINPIGIVLAVLMLFRKETVTAYLSIVYMLLVLAYIVVIIFRVQEPNYAFVPIALALSLRCYTIGKIFVDRTQTQSEK